MFSWETFGPEDVPLILAMYLNIAADQGLPFMEMGFPNGTGLLQQDGAP